ncbi:hypothetical protein BJX96DRAFT_181187 [Aspergillus floccosus]
MKIPQLQQLQLPSLGFPRHNEFDVNGKVRHHSRPTCHANCASWWRWPWSWLQKITRVLSHYHPPDILICTAGGTPQQTGFLADVSPESITSSMEVNYYTTVFIVQCCLRLWQRVPHTPSPRHIVLNSSSTVFRGLPGYDAYTPAKIAIRALADTLRQEVLLYGEDAIRVHCAFPGPFASDSYLNAHEHKPELLGMLEGTPRSREELGRRVLSASSMAQKIIGGLERGKTYITMDFQTELLLNNMRGPSPRFRWWAPWEFVLGIKAEAICQHRCSPHFRFGYQHRFRSINLQHVSPSTPGPIPPVPPLPIGFSIMTFSSPSVARASHTPYFTPANNAGAAVNPNDPSTPTLFRPLRIRDLTLKNRIMVAPMCMYSAESDPASPFVGALTPYHLAHLGHLALKGTGLIFIEATAVQPNGRISPNDSGLWQAGADSEQFKGLQRVCEFVHAQGGAIGIQLAHAGRKASTVAPWLAGADGRRKPSIKASAAVGGWPDNVVGPSGGVEHMWDPTGDGFWVPRALSTDEVKEVVRAFARSAELAVQAGVDVIEIHGAHGYLINEFMSPVTNKRTDEYGGSFENRTRIVREIAEAIRAVIPRGMPLFLRISATEWLEGSAVAAESGTWDMESSHRLVKLLSGWGIDLVDVSSGANHREQKIQPHTNYQVDLAGQLRKTIRSAGLPLLVGTVGLITEAEQAEEIIHGADEAHTAEAMLSGSEPKGDAVLLGRQFLREPEWVFTTAKKLGVKVTVPNQFARAIRL